MNLRNSSWRAKPLLKKMAYVAMIRLCRTQTASLLNSVPRVQTQSLTRLAALIWLTTILPPRRVFWDGRENINRIGSSRSDRPLGIRLRIYTIIRSEEILPNIFATITYRGNKFRTWSWMYYLVES